VFDTQAVNTPDGRISTLHEAAVFFDRGEYRPRILISPVRRQAMKSDSTVSGLEDNLG
jgi:hypothetical protein